MTFLLRALSALLVAGSAIASEPAAAPGPIAPEAAATATKLLGRIDSGRYFAPHGAFSTPVPVLRGEGSAIMDNGEIVVFKDKVATLLTIAAFPMPPVALWEFETTPPKDYLIAFFRDNILRDYVHEFPGSTIESARFLPEVFGGSMVAFTLLPAGSVFAPATPRPPTAPPLVAKRGHLVFVRDGRVFVLAVELAERITRPEGSALTTAEEDQVLFDRLITVLGAMHFGRDAAPTRTDDDQAPGTDGGERPASDASSPVKPGN